jgi:hypothetical protein
LVAQPVQQLPAAGISKSFEHFVFISNHTSSLCNLLVVSSETPVL